jgi:hypothetical protein
MVIYKVKTPIKNKNLLECRKAKTSENKPAKHIPKKNSFPILRCNKFPLSKLITRVPLNNPILPPKMCIAKKNLKRKSINFILGKGEKNTCLCES